MPLSFWIARAVIPLTLSGVAVGRYPRLRSLADREKARLTLM